MSGSWLTVGCQIVVAGTFAVAVAGKLRSRDAYRAFRDSLPTVAPALGRWPVRPVAAAVVGAEAVTVVAVAVPPLAPVGFLLAALLLAGFSTVLWSMLRRGVQVPCHCFGAAPHPPRVGDLVRNLLLLAVAVAGATLTIADAGPRSGPDLPADGTVLAAVATLSLLNLVALVVVIRRLGRLTELVAGRVLAPAVEDGPIRLAPGAAVGDFAVPTVDGGRVSRTDLNGRTLVGFMTADCPACTEALPGFIQRAEAIPGGRRHVLAIVPGGDDDAEGMRSRLAPVARVVGHDGVAMLMDAFKVTSFPAYALLSGDEVVASHHLLDRMPETVPR